ncbi:MAG: Na+/H+ antiporter subunit C [Bacteroidota bacterium]|uniref:Na(+) H(+) antiporter subunit C n=1 Tax=Christiangramia flava JLT2011 TaxID=1229726 RepID=A0A1L7I5R0_9FLAO|nr:Na+/H+ antiporter subunit C [Christiangramia flava]APU68442.1 Na(+) H(+) antiporter subunit C [Christiangramia flava JLT2011]MAM19823.1 Na+/H+ antiporter subunit C [Christiangramia sp.]MEE2771752.1 Na+/H+ antiporter subunit C [Bacteroidota bacterium]OSS40770.1 Na(+) H(+) antiporter subunit C [Christiangramia flava JLT2011]
MEILIALMIGVLYAAGIYMMLRRSLVKLIIGIILIGNGANLLIFLLGRITKGSPPIIPGDAHLLTEAYADPVPQALILTAIVISFGLQSFAIVLVKRAHTVVRTDDLDEMNATDEDS